MNKKFIKVAFVAAIALVGGVNVFNAQKANALSDIALANVEALANFENGGKKIIIDNLISMNYNPYAITATYERTCPSGGVHECSPGTFTIVTPMN